MSALRKFKALDAFPKIQDDFYSKTMSGGVITVVCSIVMACLFLSELAIFLTRQTVHQLEVDTSRGETFVMKVRSTRSLAPHTSSRVSLWGSFAFARDRVALPRMCKRTSIKHERRSGTGAVHVRSKRRQTSSRASVC